MALKKWDLRHLAIAQHVSCWSKDPSTKVGAVIADKRGNVVALGFNGFPENVQDAQHKLDDRPTKYEMTVPAFGWSRRGRVISTPVLISGLRFRIRHGQPNNYHNNTISIRASAPRAGAGLSAHALEGRSRGGPSDVAMSAL